MSGARWTTEARAGATGAAAGLPIVLTLGALAFAPLGAQAAAHGIAASFVGVVLGGLATLLWSRAALPTVGPSSATALIFAGFIGDLVADPAIDLARPADRAAVLALAGAVLVSTGVLLALLGALRLGSLSRFVPRPVLAGFMNAVAILILVGQVPALLGLSKAAVARDGLVAFAAAQPAALLVGLGTAAVAWFAARRWPGAPAALAGLLAGGLAVEAAQHVWPAFAALPRFEALAVALPEPTALAPLWHGAGPFLERHVVGLVVSAVLMTVIGSLDSMLGIMAVEQSMNTRSDPDRELLALAAANVVSGLFGGVPVMFTRLAATATFRAGGRSQRAAVAMLAAFATAYIVAAPLMARLPLAVLAGIMVTIAFAMIDGWTHRLGEQWLGGDRSADLRQSLLLVAAVCVVTLAFGFVAGVAAGTLMAMLVFIRTMNRSLIRDRCSAAAMPSRRVYPPAVEAALAPLRARIEIIELEGALFFGSSERLAADTARIEPAVACLVLDCRRVSTIDASGAVALVQLGERLARRRVTLALAGVTPGNRHGLALQALGAGGVQTFADADLAIEAAELALLADNGMPLLQQALPLAHCALFKSFDDAALQRVEPLLIKKGLRAGERLFGEGDAGDALYVVTEGSVSIVGAASGASARQRFASFSPGMSFGEIALLDGGGRTADAVADIDSTVFALGIGALRTLQASDPELAARLYRNLALHLSERLRIASVAWRRAAR